MTPKLAGRSDGRCTLTARSDSGANASSTGSLTTSAPAAIVALRSPPKVSRRFEPGTSAGPELRRPTQAAPIASGRVPQAFEMRTRSVLPPMLTRGIIRSVWLLKAAPSAGAGAAVQVPTQCALSVMVFAPSGKRLPGLQLYILVRRRPRVVGDQPQARLRDAGA